MRRILPIALLAVLAGASNAGAQAAARTVHLAGLGTEVRVGVSARATLAPWAPVAERFRGTVHAIGPDTLYLALPRSDSTVAIPRIRIQRLEASLGVSRRASALEVGSIAALVAAAAMMGRENRRQRFASEVAVGAAAVGVGFAGGALIGALVPYERWRTAWLPE